MALEDRPEIGTGAQPRIVDEQASAGATPARGRVEGGPILVPLENREEANLFTRHEDVLRYNYNFNPFVQLHF